MLMFHDQKQNETQIESTNIVTNKINTDQSILLT